MYPAPPSWLEPTLWSDRHQHRGLHKKRTITNNNKLCIEKNTDDDGDNTWDGCGTQHLSPQLALLKRLCMLRNVTNHFLKGMHTKVQSALTPAKLSSGHISATMRLMVEMRLHVGQFAGAQSTYPHQKPISVLWIMKYGRQEMILSCSSSSSLLDDSQ